MHKISIRGPLREQCYRIVNNIVSIGVYESKLPILDHVILSSLTPPCGVRALKSTIRPQKTCEKNFLLFILKLLMFLHREVKLRPESAEGRDVRVTHQWLKFGQTGP